MAKNEKWCVWRTQREETPDYEGDIPRYTGASSFEEGVQAATKWHKRDKAEIANYADPNDPHIAAIRNRKYQPVKCGDECYCQDYADEHFDGDTSLIENPNDSWDDPDEQQAEPEPPRKRFLGIF